MYTYVYMTICGCIVFMHKYCHLYFYIWNCACIGWFHKILNIGGFKSILQMHVILGLLMKGAPQGRKFANCFMFARSWNHSLCYSPIMNAEDLSFIFLNLKCDVPSHLHKYPNTCKGCSKRSWTQPSASHCSRSLGYDRCILLFVDVKAIKGVY